MITYIIRQGIYYDAYDTSKIFRGLIGAQYWDLLHEVYEMNKNRFLLYFSILNDLKWIAKEGHIGGLRVF